MRSILTLPKVFVIFAITVFITISSCNDNTDQLVKTGNSSKNFNVSQLIREFNLDTTQFKDSIITVSGIIKNINTLNNRETIILKDNTNSKTFIICDMQKNQTQILDTLNIGKSVTIKGILKGSLKDVILLNCLIEEINE